ncbi:MAG: aldehyde dehydrogenase family protein [Planctomycetota bacterium]
MKMYFAGAWRDGSEGTIDVTSPYDGQVIDTVPRASSRELDEALAGAVQGAAIMRRLPARERFLILRRTADRLLEQQQELGTLIAREEGKTLAEGIFEVTRAAETLELSAEEAKRLGGEVLPLDAAPGGAGKLGFTLRVPCGVVLAITPFNFPLNLVCHKVGPALAAGNSVILKPATDTPLSALRLIELLLESGLPALGISCVTGSGAALGDQLCADERIRKISFTGSADIGRRICQVAGLKRVTMELGSNSPLVVLADADLDLVATAVVATGYGNAGQVCISTQRVIAVAEIYDELLARLAPRVAAIRAGDPLAPNTTMGPMIRLRDAVRVEQWVGEAVDRGARVVVGGERTGTLMPPTLLADVSPQTRLSCEELFGPADAVTRARDAPDALQLANDAKYGLSAGIFTNNLQQALRFVEQIESGNIHINWGPGWRADLMPYGGLKQSGFGKEGPKYAIAEMTESKTVVIHG